MAKHWFSMLCAVFMALPNPASAQVEASLDSAQLETGNAMRLRVNVMGQKPERVDFSSWDSIVPPENRLSESEWFTRAGTWKKDLVFLAFDTGNLVLPPLQIFLPGGKTEKTPALELRVYPTPLADNQLAEIKDIHREKTVWLDYLPLILAFLALAIIGFLFWKSMQQPKNQAVVESRTIQTPPHELALRKLEALARKRLWQSGDLKNYYSELTFIAREYLEKRYPIPALESTSEEIVSRLRASSFPGKMEGQLREVLEWADLAKFAKGEPPAEFHEMALEKVRDLIQSTSI